MRRTYRIQHLGFNLTPNSKDEQSLEDKILAAIDIQDPTAIVQFKDPYETTRRVTNKCLRWIQLFVALFAFAILIIYVMMFSYVAENTDSYIAGLVNNIGTAIVQFILYRTFGLKPDLQEAGGNTEAALIVQARNINT
jgi:ABC-type Fe3+-siderophore transport system permease subunit